jgi:hypothetical protein
MNCFSRSIAAIRRSPGIVVAMVVALGPGLLGAQPGVAVEQRIHRIENALLPPALLQREAPAETKLADRMAALRVPGVSVAVLHDGEDRMGARVWRRPDIRGNANYLNHRLNEGKTK